jgi:hypothetical protein
LDEVIALEAVEMINSNRFSGGWGSGRARGSLAISAITVSVIPDPTVRVGDSPEITDSGVPSGVPGSQWKGFTMRTMPTLIITGGAAAGAGAGAAVGPFGVVAGLFASLALALGIHL